MKTTAFLLARVRATSLSGTPSISLSKYCASIPTAWVNLSSGTFLVAIIVTPNDIKYFSKVGLNSESGPFEGMSVIVLM